MSKNIQQLEEKIKKELSKKTFSQTLAEFINSWLNEFSKNISKILKTSQWKNVISKQLEQWEKNLIKNN